MPSPDTIFANWQGVIDEDFATTICQTFALPQDDSYLYRADPFAMTLAQIHEAADTGNKRWRYAAHGKEIDLAPTDITAYTSIFSSTTDASKALKSYTCNARKGSPRETVGNYLSSRRISPSSKSPKTKTHVNPYFDLWAYSCHKTGFLGPLPDPSYAHPINSKTTHPYLPVFYHHFGCVVPSHEALYTLYHLAKLSNLKGIIDMASGNGYWTYMLRRMGVSVDAVDSMASEYRTMWISDTVKADGVEYLKRNTGGNRSVLLMVYPVTAGNFTRRVLNAYEGSHIAIVGTQNANRYTGFSDCTVEEYFEREMPGWDLTCCLQLPSFAGKDEAMFIWNKR